jgi:hypothetical protein
MIDIEPVDIEPVNAWVEWADNLIDQYEGISEETQKCLREAKRLIGVL